MLTQVHPSTNMLRGDGLGYNPRGSQQGFPPGVDVHSLPGGEEILTGNFVDDGVREGRPRRPSRLFWISLPAGFAAWQELNAEIFRVLQNNTGPVVITRRNQPNPVLICPTCEALVPVAVGTISGPRHLTSIDRPTCGRCGRGFTTAEIEQLGTWL